MVPSTSLPRHESADRIARRTSVPADAEAIVAAALLPHRLELPPRVSTVHLELLHAQFGALTLGRLSYGRPATLHTDVLRDVLIACPLSGQASVSTGSADPTTVEIGSVAVFPTGATADITMTEDCAVLLLTVSRAALQSELEILLGRTLPSPLDFSFSVVGSGRLSRMWAPVVRLLVDELGRPSPLTDHVVAAKNVKRVVLDALLLGHEHNHRDLLDNGAPAGNSTVVARAMELMEERPEQDWSTVQLAVEVHLSVRALQAGFRRDVGMSPMDYLREMRLRLVRTALLDASSENTTVRAIANQAGFVHLGRLAATYRERYGETPVETLRRPAHS